MKNFIVDLIKINLILNFYKFLKTQLGKYINCQFIDFGVH